VSRNSDISIQCYLRTEQPKGGGDGLAADMGNDIFLGGIKFLPDFDNMGTQDQWYDLTGSLGKIQIGVAFKPSSVSAFVAPKSHAFTQAEVQGHSLTIDDFELTTVIGKGSFGKVCSIDLTYTSASYRFLRSCKSENGIPPASMPSKPFGKPTLLTGMRSLIPLPNGLYLLE
jgi:serum/glucocorticoid-regulated kinase 2